MGAGQGQLTKLLQDWSAGDLSALDRLTPLVYAELRKIARYQISKEGPDHTLQPTALINEAYVRLTDISQPDWNDRKHFFAAASRIMREVLVDYARKKRSVKRGGGGTRVAYNEALAKPDNVPAAVEVLVLNEALEQLARIDQRKAEVFELWCFGGQTIREISEILDVGASTVKRELQFGKVFIARAMRETEQR